MMSGYQTYNIDLFGFQFLELPAFEINMQLDPGIEKVEIASTSERRIAVKVRFKSVASQEDAASVASVVASQIADRLAFEYKIAVGDPVRGDASFESRDATGSVHAFVSNTIGLFTSGHVTKALKQEDVVKLTPFLEASEPNRDVYFAQFRWILRQDDPVARFMHLYKILLSLEGGPNHTQKNVDAFITGQEPGVQTVYSSHTGRNETIYTRLRNEVGHEISGTTPASTRQGMEQHVDKLADHVKAAIGKIK